jgi:tripartite-type tricarboxylate transporter receptor subunit TctC
METFFLGPGVATASGTAIQYAVAPRMQHHARLRKQPGGGTMRLHPNACAGWGAAAAGLLLVVAASAQNYPARTVRIVVPFGAGGGTDIQGRLLARRFNESMGQPFIVENRVGAGGLIGAEIGAKAPPDGYTILFTTASLAVNVNLYKKITFDPVKDLAPVSWVSSVPLVLVTHPSVPVKTVRELIVLAKSRPGRMNVASNGSGTTSHLSIEMLNQFAGTKVVHVPYSGGGPAIAALVSGEVDFTFATALAAQPFIKSGRARALAVTTARTAKAFPNLPTMTSLYPEFESDNWYAMFLPSATPRDIVAKVNSEIVRALKSPDVSGYISSEGGDPVGSTPDELAGMFKREIARYARIIKLAGIKPE